MSENISWDTIQKNYKNCWVQLVDFDWPEGESHPRSGTVRISAPSRKEFNKLVVQATPIDAARLYIGEYNLPDGVIISSNLIRTF